MNHQRFFYKVITICIFFIVILASCVKDKLDFENFSDRIELNPSLAAPIVKGKFTFKNLYNSDEDSVLKFKGDSIIYTFKKDSLVYFDVSDFANIPEQDTLSYFMRSDVDIPPMLMPEEFNLRKTEDFTFSFDNGMRPDSIWLNTASIFVAMESTFKHTGALRISSPSLIDPQGNTFSKVMLISSYTGSFFDQEIYPIDDYTIKMFHPDSETSKIDIHFDLLLRKTPNQGISANEYARIDFSFTDLKDFESIFGYAGQLEQGIDTIIDMDFGEMENLKGTFAVTNPKINFNYTNSMGVPFSLNLKLDGIFEDNRTVNIQPDYIEVLGPVKHTDLPVTNQVSFNRSNIPNIDSIIVFPPPLSFDLDAKAMSNPSGEGIYANFINYDSKLNVDLEIEIPLEIRADLQFIDTIIINTSNIDYVKEVEYINLYHTIYNEFPLNLDFEMVLYDSIDNRMLDTIKFGYLNNPLITAAPVDDKGIVIRDKVQAQNGFVSLTDKQADNLINKANKIIVTGLISSTQGARTVKILNNYLFDFKLGIEAKAKIEVN